MSAKVSFLSQEVTPDQQKPLLAVNPEAIATRDGRTVVFVVKDGVATEVAVTPGLKIGDFTAIAGSVKSGDKVVLRPAAELRNGAAVTFAAK
jgi:HlyD family secretion protein